MLFHAVEACFVRAAKRAAAQGVKTDFLFLTLLQGGISSENRPAVGLGDGFIEHQGCAAGSVCFAGMMPLDDFNIKIRQALCGQVAQLFERLHARAEIGSLQNGNTLRCLVDHALVGAFQTGGANKQRHAALDGKSDRLRQMRCAGKIDQHVGGLVA